MNKLNTSTLLGLVFLITITYSQSLYNQQLYDRMLKNQQIGTSELKQPDWINKETKIEVEIILENTISADQYIVGPGDQLAINIISSDGVFNYILEVTPTGELLLPLIGLIKLDQLSLNEAIRQIKELGKTKSENSKLEITLVKLRKFKVLVTGAVEESGFVVVSAIDRLSTVIHESGGFRTLAKEFEIEIIDTDGTSKIVNYLQYLKNGDLSQNPVINTGDQINVPFGDFDTESVLVRGAIEENGYDIIEPNETIRSFIQRSINFDENAFLDKIYISRGNNIVQEVDASEFNQFILKAGDEIDIPENRAVFVTGFVKNPGRYNYFIGLSIEDYIGLAGGSLQDGDPDRANIQHLDKIIERGLYLPAQRGDIIYVPQRRINMMVGKLSLLQIISYTGSIYLTYLAAINK